MTDIFRNSLMSLKVQEDEVEDEEEEEVLGCYEYEGEGVRQFL